ncbi:MAG: N-acetylneuraminate synthase family protein [bacterium]|nr:N-acetylneuraminate synthase family protein [bacterium]
MVAAFRVGGRLLAPGVPVYIVAEGGVNHDGDPEKALELAVAAKECGADAVKFQLFTPENLVAAGAPPARYQRKNAGGKDQLAMLERLKLTERDFARVKSRCDGLGLDFILSAFSEDDVRAAARLGVPALKIGSGELTDPFVLDAARHTGLPLMVSTGMANLEDVAWAVDRLGEADILLFHCTSSYPAPLEELNLRALTALHDRFVRPVGLSDHSPGTLAACLAVALGACAVEKHFTLDTGGLGPDHAASLDPAGFRELIRGIRNAERILGDGEKRATPAEENTRSVARKGLRTTRRLETGHRLAPGDLTAKRPAVGLDPRGVEGLYGRRIKGKLDPDQPLTEDDLE